MAGGSDIDPEALARADAALAAMCQDYLRWVRADVASVTNLVAGLRCAGPDSWTEECRHLFAVAHEIKGQGTTFDYPLMTALGKAMCDLLHAAPAPDDVLLSRLDALAAAMAEVVAQELCGDGGARGRELMSRREGPVSGRSAGG